MGIEIKLTHVKEFYTVVIDSEYDSGEYSVERNQSGTSEATYEILENKSKRWLDYRSRPFATISKAIESKKKELHRQKLEDQKRLLTTAMTSDSPSDTSKSRKNLPPTSGKGKQGAARAKTRSSRARNSEINKSRSTNKRAKKQ